MAIIEHIGHEQHKLILRGQGKKKRDVYHSNKPEFCSVCELPILSSPSYTCITGCDFFLHEPCARLPHNVNYPYTSEPLSLKINPNRNNPCQRCGKLCANIISTKEYFNWNYIAHPLCVVKVEIKIEHYSHNDHPLVALSQETLSSYDACSEKHEGIVKIPSHDHHLILTYASKTQKFEVCRVCHKHFCGKRMYLCAEKYDYYAHLRCVASKMGDFKPTDHPVALTRMLMVGNRRCGYCNTTVNGFVDEMNFYYFNCDFWIHYLCAKKCNRGQHQSRL
ncbi:cysteine/Histidine-rich C1 domain family protein, partial [Striga asiatica]